MEVKREWFETDYYEILGVPADASDKEVKRAYRRLAGELHPDANPGDAEAEDRFKLVSSAYDVIGDRTSRQTYDQVRKSQSSDFEGAEFGFDIGDIGDLGDLLGDVFGQKGFSDVGGPFGKAPPRATTRPTRGRDQEAQLRLTFAQAIEGATTNVSITSENEASRTIKIRVPGGVNDGQRIRLKGRGGRGLNGAPDGDLYVIVRVSEDRRFGREGLDLTLDLSIDVHDAALGATIDVPTFDNDTVSLKIPEGTASGTSFRIKGEGVSTKGKTGDLVVTVEIYIPSKLNRKQRRAMQAYAEATEESVWADL